MNSPTTSSVTTSGAGSGSTHFDIDFNESILQVHKRSPLYIIGDRAQHRVSLDDSISRKRERETFSDRSIGTISKLLFSPLGIPRCQSNQSQFQETDASVCPQHACSTVSQSDEQHDHGSSIELDVVLQVDRRISLALSSRSLSRSDSSRVDSIRFLVTKDTDDQCVHRSVQ